MEPELIVERITRGKNVFLVLARCQSDMIGIKADDRIASIYFSCRASELSLKSAPDNTLLADLCIRSLVFPSDFDIHFLEGGGGKKCSEPLIEINGFSRPLLLERIDRIPPTIDRSITRRSV